MLNRSDSFERVTKQVNRGETVHIIIITLACEALLLLHLKSTLGSLIVSESKLIKLGQSTERQTVGSRSGGFIRKASRLRRWWTNVLKNCLAWVWMLVSLLYKEEQVRS